MDNKKISSYLKNKRYKELEGYLEGIQYYENIEENKYLELLGFLKYKNKKFEEAKYILNKINSEKFQELFNEESLYWNYKSLKVFIEENNKNYYKNIDRLIELGEKELIDLKRKLYIKDKKYIKAMLCK